MWEYDWRPVPLFPMLPALAFLFLLPLGYFRQKGNLAVILPLLILNVFLLPLGHLFGSTFFYNLIGISLGAAGLLLMLDMIKYENPLVRFIAAGSIMLFFGFLTAVMFPVVGAWEKVKAFLNYSLVAFIMIFSIMLAMRFSRKRFSGHLFLAWILVSCILCSTVYMIGSFMFEIASSEIDPIMILAFPVAIIMSIFMGFGIFIFILPFILLCLININYRNKLLGIFKS